MKRSAIALVALVALLAAGLPSPVVAAVRMVFVGIDNYQFTAGKPGNSDPAFKDLGGSVNDVALVKSVLAARWRLPVDTIAAGAPCPTGAAVSMTLLNDCATRAGIIAALAGQIAAARPGDTLLFYYSGHGSQALDRSGTQAGGLNGTIVPHDGRGGSVNDILDVELRQLIDAALARGINVVTIADSCHSGSITRDLGGGQPRLAMREAQPPAFVPDVAAAVARLPPVPAHDHRPYEVQIAAADDSQVARERGTAPGRHGVFTAALAATMAELEAPSHADLFAETRRRLREANEAQTPRLQGSPGAERTAFLSGQAASPRIFDTEIAADGTSAAMAGGALSGVTPGSSFAIHAGRGAPAATAPPLALAVVDSVRAGDATLKLPAPLPGRSGPMVAVEREHAYAGPGINIRIDGGTPAQRARLQAALAARPGLVTPAAPVSHVFSIEGDRVQLYRATDRSDARRAIGSGFAADGDSVEIDAGARLVALARYATVLSLRNDLGHRWGAVNFMLACRTGPRPLPVDRASALPVAHPGDRLSIGYVNMAGQPMHARMLALDPATLEVNPLHAISRDVLENGADLRLETDPISGDGRQQILLLLSSAPVDVDALQQSAVRSLGPRASRLDRVLAAAMAGDAPGSRAIVRVNDYSVTSADMIIDPEPRKGPDPCAP